MLLYNEDILDILYQTMDNIVWGQYESGYLTDPNFFEENVHIINDEIEHQSRMIDKYRENPNLIAYDIQAEAYGIPEFDRSNEILIANRQATVECDNKIFKQISKIVESN